MRFSVRCCGLLLLALGGGVPVACGGGSAVRQDSGGGPGLVDGPRDPAAWEAAAARAPAARPAWLDSTPEPHGGRVFFAGAGRGDGPMDQAGARVAARQNVVAAVASSVMSRVHSSMDRLLRSETIGETRFFDRFVSSRVATDAEGAVWDVREEAGWWDAPGGTAWVLISVPEEVLNPTPGSQRIAWRRQARNLAASGRLAAALPLARAACLAQAEEVDADFYLSILEQLERWREARDFGERWVAAHEDGALSLRLSGGDLQRFERRAAELAAEVDWDWFVKRLERNRRRGDRPAALSASLPAAEFKQTDARGRPVELPLALRSGGRVFLIVAYQDADGLYFLFEHRDVDGERPLPLKRWNDTLPLRAGSTRGDCAVWVWSTDQPVVLPDSAIEYKRLQDRDADAAAAARGVIETLDSVVLGGGACVQIHFKLR